MVILKEKLRQNPYGAIIKELVLNSEEFLRKYKIKIKLLDCESKQRELLKYNTVKFVSIEVGKKDPIQFVYGSSAKVIKQNDIISFIKLIVSQIKETSDFDHWCQLTNNDSFEKYLELCRYVKDTEKTLGAVAIQDLLFLNDTTEHVTGEEK